MSTHGITVDRVTVNVSREQIAWLNEIAGQRATSVSDILRRLIDETRGAYLTPASARRAKAEVIGSCYGLADAT
jgi:hypothetical protein